MSALSVSEAQPCADFFVHPDFYRLAGGVITDEITQYEAALHDRIDNSELPILVHDTNLAVQTGDFWDRFPAERRFPTEKGSGVLAPDPEIHKRFNGLLDEHQVIEGIVHGSYLTHCVEGFRIRLRASGGSGTIYYHSVYSVGSGGDIFRPQTVGVGVALDLIGR